MDKSKKNWIAFGSLLLICFAGVVVSSGVQSSWGAVDVSIVKIKSSDGLTTVGKLYLPKGVNSTNPAPAVLAIHGYNNDKDVQRPHSIELSKRGIIVLAIDQLNHGDSDVAGGGGLGGSSDPQAALDWLKSQPFVNPLKIGVTGHSMGAFATLSLSLANPDLEAIAPVAFSPGFSAGFAFNLLRSTINPDIDILQVASTGEEFIRGQDQSIANYTAQCLDEIGTFVGVPDPEFFHTYGDFTNGASRFVMLKSTHPGQTHRRLSTAEITAFFLQSLSDMSEEDAQTSINKGNCVYWIADLFGVIAMAGMLFSIIPLASLFMDKETFKEIRQPMPKYREAYAPKTGVWWIFGLVNAALGFLTYVFNMDYSKIKDVDGTPTDVAEWVLDGTMLQNWFPNVYRSGIANDFEAFFLVNALISICIITFWYFMFYRKKHVGLYDLGAVYTDPENNSEKKHGWRIFGKTVILAGILFIYMYAITALAAHWFNVEMRGPWSGFKVMTPTRATDFLPFLIGPLLFWICNGGMWMFGMMRQKEQKTEAGTVFVWWIKISVVMLTGLVVLNLIQYLPMFLGFTGPYLNEWAVAPMDLLQTWSFIPYSMGYYLIAVMFYRKTGKIWLGTLIASSLTTWMLVTGYIWA